MQNVIDITNRLPKPSNQNLTKEVRLLKDNVEITLNGINSEITLRAPEGLNDTISENILESVFTYYRKLVIEATSDEKIMDELG